MPKRIRIELSAEAQAVLERWSKQAPRPYLRERARAILAVAEGQPIYQVAAGLRVRVHRNAVREWVKRFEAQGVEGLRMKKGRGRKPAFSPSPKGSGQTGSGAGA